MTTLEQAAREALLSDLRDIESMLGGPNGPTMRLRAALAAGQAQPVGRHVFNVTVSGSLHEWEPTAFAFALPDGKHALYTAPPSQPVAPAGWKLVPVEPTQEMCQEGQRKAREWPKFPLRISPIYRAMLSASPPAPAVRPLTDHDLRDVFREVVHDDALRIYWPALKSFARAAIAEFCRKNGISAAGGEEGDNAEAERRR